MNREPRTENREWPIRPFFGFRFSVFGSRFIIVFLLAGCSRPPVNDYGPVPDFTLTERSGKSVSRADLQGKVWVAACVFTRCTGSCPVISGVMASLHHELKDQKNLVFVSVSVDPEHDTPEVLAAYAKSFAADPERWLYLTGPKDDVYHLIRQGFLLGVEPTQGTARQPGNEVEHSPRLTLVDRQGRKRGFYDARDGAKIEELKKQIAVLIKER